MEKIVNFLKTKFAEIKPKERLAKIKEPRIIGTISTVLSIVTGLYAFLDVDVAVKRGPLTAKLFGTAEQVKQRMADKELARLEAMVVPRDGAVLPVIWGDLGKQLVEAGVIDAEKFEKLYAGRAAPSGASLAPSERGGMRDYEKSLLYGTNNGQLKITQENSGFLLNMLWALGLGNKNDILEKGPMVDKKYGGDASRFASTGGWTLAKGKTMSHYSHHQFMNLTPEQQELVVKTSQGIYRPCCGNSTHFPDCNHGMAMLGLLELMASQGLSEEEMHKVALAVNAYWFPDTYLTIAKYLETKGLSWAKTEPRALLGANFSSSSGYRQILNQVSPPQQRSGGSCGV